MVNETPPELEKFVMRVAEESGLAVRSAMLDVFRKVLADYFMNEPTVPDDAPVGKWAREILERVSS